MGSLELDWALEPRSVTESKVVNNLSGCEMKKDEEFNWAKTWENKTYKHKNQNKVKKINAQDEYTYNPVFVLQRTG